MLHDCQITLISHYAVYANALIMFVIFVDMERHIIMIIIIYYDFERSEKSVTMIWFCSQVSLAVFGFQHFSFNFVKRFFNNEHCPSNVCSPEGRAFSVRTTGVLFDRNKRLGITRNLKQIYIFTSHPPVLALGYVSPKCNILRTK